MDNDCGCEDNATATDQTAVETNKSSVTVTAPALQGQSKSSIAHVSISYCCRCRWVHRANWYAMELLSTFTPPNSDKVMLQVTLVPVYDPSGTFIVTIDDQVIWDRTTEGRFPDAKELKQAVRTYVAPDMSLGHSDKPVASAKQ